MKAKEIVWSADIASFTVARHDLVVADLAANHGAMLPSKRNPGIIDVLARI
jgi:hypothetical protein